LDVLDRDQDRLLYDGDPRREPEIQPLGDGFRSYWMLLSWYQAAGIRTLGHVEKVIAPADIMPESGIVDHLLTPVETEGSAYVRRRLVERLDDACDLAYRQFRERANERVGNEAEQTYDQVDPEKEQNPLMRPAFRRLDRGQTAALCSLWEGFEDREAIGRWVRSLASVSNGEKPAGLLDKIVASEPLLTALLSTESAEAHLTRYRFAVGTVLPAFLSGARTLNGGENTNGDGMSHGAFNS
jgi:hypothetical protein